MVSSAIRFDTTHIGTLRTLLDRSPGLRSLGSFAQFHVVLDANAVIADLLQKVRHPDRGATAIEELVRSTVFVVHAPRWLEMEITESAVPQAAAKRKLPLAELEAHWEEYRALIHWDDSLGKPDPAAAGCCDPADLPYVRLQQKIGACGIVSRDRHISELGGHRLTADFVLSSRAYARSAATSTGTRLGLLAASMLTLSLLALIVRSLVAAFRALPPAAQTLLLGAALTAATHPRSRAWIAERSGDLANALASGALLLVEGLGALTSLCQEAKRAANAHLAAAMVLAVKPRPRTSPVGRPLRRRRVSATSSASAHTRRPRDAGLPPSPRSESAAAVSRGGPARELPRKRHP
jgi:hypothetical protein